MKTTAVRMLLCLSFAACGSKTIDIEVNVVHGFCDPALDPFLGVNFLQMRVSAMDGGIALPLVAQTMTSTDMVQVPQIPAGPRRIIEVRGYADDPMRGGTPISIGRSLPFDVPDVVSNDIQPIQINVFLRRVDTFSQPVSDAHPGDCQVMGFKRAGHTAVLLQDGRVFIAGGFTLDGTTKTALASTEFYEPATGAFTVGPNLQIGGQAQPRAYLSSTLLRSGSVLLHGGESYTGTPQTTATSSASLVFDLVHNSYGVVKSRIAPDPPSVGRSRHLAIPVASGQVLIVGGVKRSATGTLIPAPEIEWYEPSNATVYEYPVDAGTFARIDGAGASLQGGQYAAVVGGVDENNALTDEIAFWSYDGTTFNRGPSQHLQTPRRSAATAVLSDSSTLLVMGGFADPTNVAPIETTEAVKTMVSMSAYGPNIGARGGICAALLPQGQVMAVGGRNIEDGGQNTQSDDSAERISFDPQTGVLSQVGMSTLKKGRWGHTCTTLQDGSVLITGGVNEGAGDQTVLQDAWIYTPIPAD
jgi:hypothetical protein